MSEFMDRAAAELTRAREKHPSAMCSTYDAFGIIEEEVLEFRQAVYQDADRDDALRELIQVAAMCWRAVEDLDLVRYDFSFRSTVLEHKTRRSRVWVRHEASVLLARKRDELRECIFKDGHAADLRDALVSLAAMARQIALELGWVVDPPGYAPPSSAVRQSARDGLGFEGLSNGAVRVLKFPEGAQPFDPGVVPDWIVTLDAECWCSIIASMSKWGQGNGGWVRALSFHGHGTDIPTENDHDDQLEHEGAMKQNGRLEAERAFLDKMEAHLVERAKLDHAIIRGVAAGRILAELVGSGREINAVAAAVDLADELCRRLDGEPQMNTDEHGVYLPTPNP